MSNDPRCAKCGHPRSNHPYRHMFVGASRDDAIKNQADRIEELEEKLLSAAMDGYDTAKYEYRERIEELEANLKMAMEALKAIARPKVGDGCVLTDDELSRWRDFWYHKHGEIARAANAALKGQDDEVS